MVQFICLRKKNRETTPNFRYDEELTRLDPVLHAVELPAGVTHLDSGLADVDADAFSHRGFFKVDLG